MARGRPVLGGRLVDALDAPRAAQRRVRVILATLNGTQTIAEACTALGIGRSRFHALRQQVLRGALDAVTGRARGRPPTRAAVSPEVAALRARIRELELTLRTALLRSEIALTMPFLLDRAARKKKGGRRRPSTADPARPPRPRAAQRRS